ncbi:MAG: AAA family ATPase, partial [Oscillospiraceae bacterium]|nr:AAA family ATPase [Oscillospiraceae bacterium]
SDRKTKAIYVYDWRAPISSMYYDYGRGPAEYSCGMGTIKGAVTLKRQYKVEGDRLGYMFDSDLTINDEALREMLAKSADDRMKTIVTTIQREQNAIIRDEGTPALFVGGPAGSGKTSIALHRAAYILYRSKGKVESENILILSPSRVFNDYISGVLPELGEDAAMQSTFEEYTAAVFGFGDEAEEKAVMSEKVFGGDGTRLTEARRLGMAVKSAPWFPGVLDRYASDIDGENGVFQDLVYKGETVLSGREMEGMYRDEYKSWPMARRLNKIMQRAFFLLEPHEKARIKEISEDDAFGEEHFGEVKAASRLYGAREFNAIRDGLKEALAVDGLRHYAELFKGGRILRYIDPGERGLTEDGLLAMAAETASRLDSGFLAYEDRGPAMYLRVLLEGVTLPGKVRHVIMDEFQDYTPVEAAVAGRLFGGGSMTCLGDFDQRINPAFSEYGFGDVVGMSGFRNPKVLTLNKSFRSTREIALFAKAILGGGDEYEYVNRPGELPAIVRVGVPASGGGAADAKTALAVLAADIAERSAGVKSAAVICPSQTMANAVYDAVRKVTKAHLMKKDDDGFFIGLTIAPCYLVKGLEFDSVFFYDAGAGRLRGDPGSGPGAGGYRKMLYTACTRALHTLRVYHTGEASPLLTPLIDGSGPRLAEVTAIGPA